MKFNYYVYEGKAYVSKYELKDMYGTPYTTLIYHLKKNKDIPVIFLGKIEFYKCKEVVDYLNRALKKDISLS